jgi:hypothetical protein
VSEPQQCIRDLTIPMRLVTLENQREHWATKARRAKSQRMTTRFILCGARPFAPDAVIPCVVTLTRIAPRRLDSGNFQACFKHVQDGVADWLGADDANPRIEWRYEQQRGEPKQYAVRIQIERASQQLERKKVS